VWIDISYSHCNNESFGGFIIYSFSMLPSTAK
jgi:hypothetical protein